jgi:hypothetical protein
MRLSSVLTMGLAGALLGAGIAAGAECDSMAPEWVMCEDFEAGNGDWDTWWAATDFVSGSGIDSRGRVTLSSDQPHSGQWAAYMPAADTAGNQGASLDWFACDGDQRTNCPLLSFDSLYFRVWIRFAGDHRYVHHFMSLGGSQPDDFWYHGTAGCLPNGELAMGTTVDHREDSHESFFYTYTPDMTCDMRCERYADVAAICQDCLDKGLPTCVDTPQCCWGNLYESDTPFAFPVDRWFAFEMMMRPNTPGVHDGAMAYWVDDSLIHREDSLLWRTSPTLAMNRMRVQHYITQSDAGGHSNRVWFDDVVVSTAPIGSGDAAIENRHLRGRWSPHARVRVGRSGNRLTLSLSGGGNPVSYGVQDISGRVVWCCAAVTGPVTTVPLPAGCYVVKATTRYASVLAEAIVTR